ncbi:uncharacterized protein I303_107074 [Kwoniella dejecticola CBS 10117]|uniref:Uncharacterized protein n=1 Tax=Kwoniella dejecticola CBS 10117 TaxID=1296121 RepID=A0A1A5ZYN1_9TREE|nr:uncharacterized protein I303_06475 [Kwoniella dejecticola CBS 10117]OBR82917.1 hypothetical protein I303_06475 [Kwoniella dejecticola CBS 10117]
MTTTASSCSGLPFEFFRVSGVIPYEPYDDKEDYWTFIPDADSHARGETTYSIVPITSKDEGEQFLVVRSGTGGSVVSECNVEQWERKQEERTCLWASTVIEKDERK